MIEPGAVWLLPRDPDAAPGVCEGSYDMDGRMKFPAEPVQRFLDVFRTNCRGQFVVFTAGQDKADRESLIVAAGVDFARKAAA